MGQGQERKINKLTYCSLCFKGKKCIISMEISGLYGFASFRARPFQEKVIHKSPTPQDQLNASLIGICKVVKHESHILEGHSCWTAMGKLRVPEACSKNKHLVATGMEIWVVSPRPGNYKDVHLEFMRAKLKWGETV